MKKIVLIIISNFLLISVFSCNTTEPGGDNGNDGQDTTSQNFTFETYEFGDGSNSSYFTDVWIFDENNIWAVGYIFDPSFKSKNILHWNGSNWNPLGIQFNTTGIEGIWALDSSNIFFAAGFIINYNKGKFIETDLGSLGFTNGQRVEKLWGSSEQNIYGVGPWGTIVHFNGSKWTKVEFDTQWYFYGITGNKETGIAYAVGRNSNYIFVIVEINSLSANTIYSSENTFENLTAYGIKIYNDKELILSDMDIWKFNIDTKNGSILEDLPPGYFLPRIGIAGENDVYFWGNKLNEGERMIHYNGKRFTAFNLPQREYVIYGGVYAIKDLSVMAAGSDDKAYLIKIKRRWLIKK